jgi:hypothetical protein
MSRDEELLLAAIRSIGPKPLDSASQPMKKRFSEQLSEAGPKNR